MLLNLQEKHTLAKPPNQTKTTHQQKTQSKTQQKKPHIPETLRECSQLIMYIPHFSSRLRKMF